jgi:tetratricopeptide (TPR) repeat protein
MLENWLKAKVQFDAALRLHRGFQMAQEGKALALRGLAAKAAERGDADGADKYLQQAEGHYKLAIYWAGRQGASTARFYNSIGWFNLDQKRYEGALASFDSAIGNDPEHFLSYWGKGAALKFLKRYAEAVDSLNVALSKAPQPLKAPASEEIPKLIEECENELKSQHSQ